MLLARHPPSFPEERAYTFDVVLSDGLGVRWRSIPEERNDVELLLEGAPPQRRVVLPDCVFGQFDAGWPRSLHLPDTPLRAAHGPWVRNAVGVDEVPVLFGRPAASGAWIEDDGERLSFGIDVFATAFVLLSRVEELAGGQRDEHGRFPAVASLGHRLGFLDRPLVDEHVELLRAVLEHAFPGLVTRRPRYAEDVTHDIDFVDGRRLGVVRELRSAARHLLSDRAPVAAGRRLAAVPLRPVVGPRCDVFNTFDDLMRISEQHGLRSTFFFIAGRTPGGRDDDNYEIGEPWVRSLLRTIADNGHEIGLHGSYGSFDSPGRLRSELDALRTVLDDEGIDAEAIGCRQHFLRFDPARTWPAQAAAGIAFDSTVCFPDAAGFRSGTCREHPVFDAVGRRRLPLRERPLTLMDSTVLDPAYLDLRPEEAGRTAEELKRACRRVGGTFRLLWHNTTLVTPAQRSLYGEILAC